MPIPTTERAFENAIVNYLIENNGYERALNSDFDKRYALDLARVVRFLQATQGDNMARIMQSESSQQRFFMRLHQALNKYGVVEVLRKGIKHEHTHLTMYYVTPSPHNESTAKLYAANIFSIMPQVHYCAQHANLSVDMVVFVNGLPVLTMELKNSLTGQYVAHAVAQYKKDRDPKALLFSFKRCMVHFAVDDNEVRMCTHLQGEPSWFLPFNKGNHDSAGNPVNPVGFKTDYLYKDILRKSSLSDILENYARLITIKNPTTGAVVEEKMIFPRYHQLDLVRQLLHNTQISPLGRRYLIQHSAGSGKSNSIAWLAYQLVNMKADDELHAKFDSVIVVTDRRNLDKQIRDTVRQFMDVNNTLGWADDAGKLRELLATSKKIIITTIQKFAFIVNSISSENRNKNFAILIDEAHSSQSGEHANKMNKELSGVGKDTPEEDAQDIINRLIDERIEGRKFATNANYYAFTATPKNKTLEMFGEPYALPDGTNERRPFHVYSMRQAIEEGFIMDVLLHYMSIKSYYKIIKSVKDNPYFDKNKAQKILHKYVEGHEQTIKHKAEVMVTHFLDHVIARGKIGGQARAMVVTAGIQQAIKYYFAFKDLLQQHGNKYKAIIAFSGEKEYNGSIYTEHSLNDFPSTQIERKFKEEPYRFLIVADKFQTGYDEPLLHTMYVDKPLSDLKAVQTLSRLNRAHRLKRDTCVLDFANDPEEIQKAFQRYYKQTILSAETDPNKLNDLIATIEPYQVYSQADVDELVRLFLNDKEARERFEPILNKCAENYSGLNEKEQITFKGSVKTFLRTYYFLASILTCSSREWEKAAIFLSLLVRKLSSPKEDNELIDGLLQSIDYDSYRNIIQSEQKLILQNETAKIDPIPLSNSAGARGIEVDTLSAIIEAFNKYAWGEVWKNKEEGQEQIEQLIHRIAHNETYQNAIKNADREAARIESNKLLSTLIAQSVALSDNLSNVALYKKYNDDKNFQVQMQDFIFQRTYELRK